ncbi:MAG TPA: ATP-binding protein, partial [Parafilimonas sp.]|nr:ATP-binding protein [Parafilimonas sp.]
SKTSTGKKEPTDINALCDEYLRLSYHGMRARDKSFNATLQTGFDETLGKINIVPQDIGRVLLNLFNNAFYAVSERRKAEGVGYKPVVSVTTKLSSPSPSERGRGEVEIRVRDNGSGIPESVVAKIFQPFFTTKPTGQGTGLGLSLSYDIIKAHGGEIKVETNEDERCEFVIHLPITPI